MLAALLAFTALRVQSAPVRTDTPTTPQCNGSCAMTDYGGHVLPNVKVYAVLWGSSVDTTITDALPGFYAAATNSEWMDWLAEYNTSSQRIGRGTFAGAYAITPSVTATSITDSQISAELAAQIAAGNLPAPDEHTIYMTYFAPGVVIDDGTGAKSCTSGGFCAYHSTFQSGSQTIYYGVVPDFGAHSGCNVGCGSGTQFENVCSASSHELIEAVTDADVGLVTGSSLNGLGWYNATNGEVGDMCNQHFGTVGTYTVQQIYSSALNQCITTKPGVVGPSAAPNRVTLSPGGQLDVAITPGASGTLSVTPPAGITGTFSGNTLTLAASASAAPARDQVVVVTETSGSTVHTTSVLVEVKLAASSDFTIAVSPGTAVLGRKQTATFTVSTTAIGAPESVALSVSGLPSGVTPSFSAATITSGDSATLTLTASSTAAVGQATFTVTGTAATAHVATAKVTVLAEPTVSLSVPAGTLSGFQTLKAEVSLDASTTLASVVFFDGAVSIGTSTSAPAALSWDTHGAADGTHSLTAKVTDSAGQVAVSPAVSVQVSNAPAPPEVTVPVAPAGGCATAAVDVLALLGLVALRQRKP